MFANITQICSRIKKNPNKLISFQNIGVNPKRLNSRRDLEILIH